MNWVGLASDCLVDLKSKSVHNSTQIGVLNNV
jgi:hypothetical protein